MARPAIQLYTLREFDEPLTETLLRVGETTYEGVEFAGLGDESPDAIADALDDAGLVPVGAHVGLDAFESDYAATVERYRTLGCDRIVVPSYGEGGFGSVASAMETADDLSSVADRLVADGFEAHYHNHTYEFAALEASSRFETAYDAFAAYSDDQLGLEFDVGLAQHGGVDPTTYLDRYADRLSLIHLTDTNPGDDDTLHVDLDEGVVDLNACVSTAAAADVDWVIHENGLTTDPEATLESSSRRLQELLDDN
ncbi:sugar phosphate isomerase/epimerase family protein [Haloprofundus halobius]|uniref:sugar phosphate isomerase/epimerase family protein n=1 Tax=Haloprofundus halobius TaxID=2876194 RepID=UPI001CCE89C7|nr:sugar phosphate isomerase/epimerase [Haloprofundus halobius]